MAGRFDAIWLDAGGVLVLPDPTVLGPLLAYYGGDRRRRSPPPRPLRGDGGQVGAGRRGADWREYDRAYVRSVGVADADVEEAAAGARPHPHARSCGGGRSPSSVAALRRWRAGVPLGVVSNAMRPDRGRAAALAACARSVPAPASRCAASSTATSSGCAKPDPAIFDHAAVHFPGIDRERVAYVGDSVTMDVVGATAAGLHPILLDPYDDHPDADFERIRSLADLV